MSIRNIPTNAIVYFILSFTLGAYLVQPIWDTDFWWHIASGKWIIESLAIPNTDPFGVFPNPDPIRLDTVLRGQWLGQVVLFLSFDYLGTNGILALRALIILTSLALVVRRATLLHSTKTVTLLYVGLAGIIAIGFTGTRPQLFSFLFAALIFLFVDRFNHQFAQGRQYKLLILLPVVAILWANFHGAVILGTVLLFMYSSYKLVESFITTRSFSLYSIALMISSLLFFIGSLLTPNGIDTYLYLVNLEGSQLQQLTSEYVSSLRLYTLGYTYVQGWIGLLLLISLIGIVGLYPRYKGEAGISLFLLIISVAYYRYLAFLIFISGPYICLGISNLIKKIESTRLVFTPRTDNYFSLAIGVVALIALVLGMINHSIFRGGINPGAFPISAVAFIKNNNITGRAFNYFRWGGYLIWNLPNKVKPYIDGRMLDTKKLPPYTHMLWATPQGISLFERQQFDLVILPWRTAYSGETYKLHQYLNRQPTWRLIYRDQAHGDYVYQRVRD